MDNNKVNVVNGMVTGVFLGTPMQDATPDTPNDNKPYATERNTESRLSNYDAALEHQPEKSGSSTGGGALVVNMTVNGGGGADSNGVMPFDATLDKTYVEIKAAVDAGIPVEIRSGSSPQIVMRLFQNDTNGYMHFSCLYCNYDPRGYKYDGTSIMYCLCVQPSGCSGSQFTIK